MPTDDENAVLAAAEARASALVARDETTLRALLHPNLQWTTFRGKLMSCDQYVAANTAGGTIWRSQTLDDVAVTVVGDAGVLTALVTDDVTRDGQDGRFRLRLTQTWVREGDRWRLLGGHAGPQV